MALARRAPRYRERICVAVAGPVLLLAVLLMVGREACTSLREAEAIASRSRLAGLDDRLLETDLASLLLAEAAARGNDGSVSWEAHLRLVEGTPRATLARGARTAWALRRMEARLALADHVLERVERRLAEGQWAAAARIALDLPRELEGSEAGLRVLERARQALRERARLILVAGGERQVGGGADRRTVRVQALLIALEPARTGSSLPEAAALARLSGMRLPTAAERMAAEAEIEEARAAQPEPDGALPLEWVEAEPDEGRALDGRGYGRCMRVLFGSASAGAAEAGGGTRFVIERRLRDRGYADVAFRPVVEVGFGKD